MIKDMNCRGKTNQFQHG